MLAIPPMVEAGAIGACAAVVERAVADFMQRDVEPGAMARHALRTLIAVALYPLGTYHGALRESKACMAALTTMGCDYQMEIRSKENSAGGVTPGELARSVLDAMAKTADEAEEKEKKAKANPSGRRRASGIIREADRAQAEAKAAAAAADLAADEL